MALTIKKSNWDSNGATEPTSPLQKSLWVTFSIRNKTLNSSEISKIDEELLNSKYTVMLSEPLELKVETEWTETGGAEIAKKINQIFNSNLIKALAGSGASNHAPNNDFSQKTTEIGKPLSTQLKFRMYDNQFDESNSINQNNQYWNLIKFLTLVCAPRKPYSLGDSIFEPLVAAGRNSRKFFENLRNSRDTSNKDLDTFFKKNFDEDDPKRKEYEKLKNTVSEEGLKKYYKDLIENYSINQALTEFKENKDESGINISKYLLANNRYNYTLQLENTIFNNNKDARSDYFNDWFIKSFTWTPSTEIMWDTQYELPMPLWVDFEINLETCIAWPKELLEQSIDMNLMHKKNLANEEITENNNEETTDAKTTKKKVKKTNAANVMTFDANPNVFTKRDNNFSSLRF